MIQDCDCIWKYCCLKSMANLLNQNLWAQRQEGHKTHTPTTTSILSRALLLLLKTLHANPPPGQTVISKAPGACVSSNLSQWLELGWTQVGTNYVRLCWIHCLHTCAIFSSCGVLKRNQIFWIQFGLYAQRIENNVLSEEQETWNVSLLWNSSSLWATNTSFLSFF